MIRHLREKAQRRASTRNRLKIASIVSIIASTAGTIATLQVADYIRFCYETGTLYTSPVLNRLIKFFIFHA